MRKLGIIYTHLLVLSFIHPLCAQDTIFFEDFDNSPGSKPSGWISELEAGDSKWEFVNGGGTKNPDIPGSRRPSSAYSGAVNALYFFESLEGESVILVTPPINMELALRPELRFMHVQREGNLGFGAANDELRIYYKTHLDSAWTEIRKIAEYTDEVYDWTEQTVLLPEEAFVPECYIAFKAKTKYGWGVGIDDVSVIETDVRLRQVDTVTFYQEETGILPSGSKSNQLLRIDVSVKGNTGAATLNSLDLSSLNTNDDDIPAYGVKLYYHYNKQDFFAATLLDSASFVSGEAQFSSLDLNLPSGHTSLWVAYDIKEDAVHANLADAMLKAGSMNINGNTYPAIDVSPAGNRMIQEAVFYDDFSTDKNWTLAGDFERDRPRGMGGAFLGNPDPSFAAVDTMILGNDLTGLGSNLGDYEASVNKYDNLASSPSFNLFYYNDVKVNFLRWLNVANNDTASIELSLDGGSSWEEVWSNNNNVFTDGEWKNNSMSLPGASRQADVRMRFNLGPTTPTDHLSGWNIENFAITGNYVEYDVGPTALLSPGSSCGLSAAEMVSVRVENFGPGATPDRIPVRYSFDGGSTFTTDTLNGSMVLEGYQDFNFSKPIDLSTPGVYNVVLETLLEVDEEGINNRFDTVIYVDPVYTLPYIQDFEEGNDFWRVEGSNTSFEYGSPVGSIIHTAASGVKAWVTNLDGEYNDDEDSYLLGPCFDFTGIDYPIFECSLFLSMEDEDGVNLEYSLDKGQTWSRLGSLGEGASYYWNWYNSDVISSLDGGHGWTGGSGEWLTSRIELDTSVFRNMPCVKFRFHFASDASGRLEGIGVDDIRVYEIPRDVGVVSIEQPMNGCAQEIADHVAVTIKNFSLDTLMAGEILIVAYDYESEPTVTDTFVLESNVPGGGTLAHIFTDPLEISSSGWQNIEAFTLLSDDIDFYNETVTNDSTSKSFEVSQTPYVYLQNSIYTVRPDTVVLNASSGAPAVTYLWQDNSTDPIYHVTSMSDGTYYVTASNTYCEYSDTSRIYRLIADVGVTSMMEPFTGCELGEIVNPRIEITNFGSDTLDVGDEIPLRCRVNAEPVIEETAVLTAQVLPDSSFVYTFATALDMSVSGIYSVSSYTELPYDDTLSNDTLKLIVEVYGYTSIDLGSDTVVRAFEHIIDAGTGYESYLWQDGSTGQTLLIDTSGQYMVTVQQGTMCPNTDSVYISLVIPDIAVERLSNPIGGCGLSATEHVEFYVKNTGTDTIWTGDTVFISYQFEGGDLLFDTIHMDRKLVPSDSILFSSTETVDVSKNGVYQFMAVASYAGDLIPENNAFDQRIEVYTTPSIFLGDDLVVNTARYTLDAGAGFVSYVWQDGSGGQFFVAAYANQTPDSTYSIIATDEHGCEASDEIQIGFDLWDVGISSIQSPGSGCYLSDQEEIRLYIRNYGTHAIVDESVSVTTSVDHKTPVTILRTISQMLNSGDSLEFLFKSGFDFSSRGDHHLLAYSTYGQDADPSTDTLEVIVSHLGLPAPELGGKNDTLGTQLPFTLDAGAGFVSYQWNGVDGNRTYDAVQYGWYRVGVMDPDGCSAGDSIYLTSVTGLEDWILPGDLTLYPVPASRYLHIRYSYEEVEDLVLDIFDSNGRKIFIQAFPGVKEFIKTIDVSGLAKGLYYIRLRSDEQQLSRTFTLK